jgi:hypothetical protein
VVFTLPHALNPLIVKHKSVMLTILFKAVSETLTRFGEHHLGGKLGFVAVLHTWDQQLKAHYHLHCLVAGGYQQLKHKLYHHTWVVSVREPIREAHHLFQYLARYTHRVAIANSRLTALKDGMDFRYKDRKNNRLKTPPSVLLPLSAGFCSTRCPRALSESGTMAF